VPRSKTAAEIVFCISPMRRMQFSLKCAKGLRC
jgi:hypothetical protein